jgi:transcription antitermination factor NusG
MSASTQIHSRSIDQFWQNSSPESWFALRVRSRSEIAVSSLLTQKGFESYAPTYSDVRKYSDRTRNFQAPLFPGYVFCRFDPADRLTIVSTPAVQHILSTGGRLASIALEEIDSVRRAAAVSTARPHPYLSIGQKVRVQSGALCGVEGFLVSRKGGQRLVISADLLQRAISVELDSYQIAAA